MMVSIGIIEINNIAKGYLVCDNILKKSQVQMVMAQPVCPGKFVMIFGGSVSSVKVACDYARVNFSENILDISEFGNIDVRVFDALNGAAGGDTNGALGIVETFSVSSCILAADAALKAANVEVVELRVARGMAGKSYVALSGTVAAVTAGVEAGAQNAIDNGLLNDTAVIASPHEDLWQYLQ